jgi:plasmid stabilization system protein ParE
MRELLIQPKARTDLLEIWHYIAEQSHPAANRVIQRLEAAFNDLVSMPGMGHRRPDVSDRQYRFWTVYSYLIAYRYDEKSVTVVRVVHGKRNIRRLLAETRG